MKEPDRATETSSGDRSKRSKKPSPVGQLIAPVKSTLLLACLFQAVSAVAGVMPFIAVAEVGRALLAEEGTDSARVWWIAALGAAALVVRLVFLMVAGGLTHLADLDLQLDLRRRMADRLRHVPLGWFGENSSGAVKKALQDDVTALHHMVGHAYTNMTAAVVTPLIAFGYLIWTDWRLALVAAVPLGLGMALYGLQFRGFGDKMAAYEAALQDVNAASVEFVQGIAVVKTFGQGRKAYGRFVERTQAFVAYFWEWVRGLLRLSATTEIVLSPLFSLVVILIAGLLLVGADSAAPADILAFAVLAPGLTAPFLTLAFAQTEVMLAKEAANRIVALLEMPVLPEPAVARKPQGSRIAFEAVSFSYDGDKAAVRELDMILEPGTVTALVGPSGSGKSTLARLLPRFWDPDTGRITIGGVATTDITADDLYRSVSFVFQDVQLLRASLRENIALARPDASQSAVEDAARAAQIHDRIVCLPRGYDSIVGVDAQLSGGEAQRVSIARAILADPQVLVLDEATAFADPESEAAIQDALTTLVAGRTLLVIGHRLRTIIGADQICVMEEGRIVERGRHEDLLQHQGLYARLWSAGEASPVSASEAAS